MRFLLLLAVLLTPIAAHAQALTVFAAASLTDALKDISTQWTQAGHAPLRLSFGASSTLARQIEQGRLRTSSRRRTRSGWTISPTEN